MKELRVRVFRSRPHLSERQTRLFWQCRLASAGLSVPRHRRFLRQRRPRLEERATTKCWRPYPKHSAGGPGLARSKTSPTSALRLNRPLLFVRSRALFRQRRFERIFLFDDIFLKRAAIDKRPAVTGNLARPFLLQVERFAVIGKKNIGCPINGRLEGSPIIIDDAVILRRPPIRSN